MNTTNSFIPTTMEDTLKNMKTQEGVSLWDISMNQPALLVFLRHFGCTFCREALSDIAAQRAKIEENEVKIVFVHMSTNKLAERYFNRYNLSGIDHISDQECQYYADFGLIKGTFTQLFGLKTWMRGFQTGIVKGHFIGTQLGDGFQMPGVFTIKQGKIHDSFVHQIVSDRPDYTALVKCCSI